MLSWSRRLFGPRAKAEEVSTGPAGTLFTLPATWEDVVLTARLLNLEGVRYLLVGGYALAAHGGVRMTEDIDIPVGQDLENIRRWVLALSGLPDGAARELTGAGSIPKSGIEPPSLTGSPALRRMRRTISALNASNILRTRRISPIISA